MYRQQQESGQTTGNLLLTLCPHLLKLKKIAFQCSELTAFYFPSKFLFIDGMTQIYFQATTTDGKERFNVVCRR
jgi:hypothetical protein